MLGGALCVQIQYPRIVNFTIPWNPYNTPIYNTLKRLLQYPYCTLYNTPKVYNTPFTIPHTIPQKFTIPPFTIPFTIPQNLQYPIQYPKIYNTLYNTPYNRKFTIPFTTPQIFDCGAHRGTLSKKSLRNCCTEQNPLVGWQKNLGTFLPAAGGKFVGFFCPPQAGNFGSFLPTTGGKVWDFLNYRVLYKVLYWGCCTTLGVFGGVVYFWVLYKWSLRGCCICMGYNMGEGCCICIHCGHIT